MEQLVVLSEADLQRGELLAMEMVMSTQEALLTTLQCRLNILRKASQTLGILIEDKEELQSKEAYDKVCNILSSIIKTNMNEIKQLEQYAQDIKVIGSKEVGEIQDRFLVTDLIQDEANHIDDVIYDLLIQLNENM